MMATGLFDQLLRSGQDLLSGKPAAGQDGGGPLDALGGLFNKGAAAAGA